MGSFTVCTGWVTGSIPSGVLEPDNKISSGGCCAQLLLCLKTGKDIFFLHIKTTFMFCFFTSLDIYFLFSGIFSEMYLTRCAVPCWLRLWASGNTEWELCVKADRAVRSRTLCQSFDIFIQNVFKTNLNFRYQNMKNQKKWKQFVIPILNVSLTRTV